MRNSFIALICLFVCGSVFSNNTFEGNLTYTTEKNGSTVGKLSLAVKNDLVAINPGSGSQMVLNVSTGDLHAVIKQGDQKSLVKVNLSVLQNMQELPDFIGPFAGYFGANGREAAEIKATSETKTIAGFKSKKYIIKDSQNVTEVWVTNDIPFSFAPLFEMLKFSPSMTENFKNSFPLQGNVKSKNGETSTFQVSVKKQAVDESFFKLPEDMPILDMTPLVKQMLEKNDPKQIKAILDQFIPK